MEIFLIFLNSNTTLVKVKLLWLIVNIHGKMDSNTTLVKVKLMIIKHL